MAKRKVKSEPEDSESAESSAEENPKARQRPKVSKVESQSDYSDSETPLAKKPKTEQDDASCNGPVGVVVKTTAEGEKYIELGKKKRATVRTFKGTPLVDIREFYTVNGEDKPGKKGISLGLEQWEALKMSTDKIDELLASLKNK